MSNLDALLKLLEELPEDGREIVLRGLITALLDKAVERQQETVDSAVRASFTDRYPFLKSPLVKSIEFDQLGRVSCITLRAYVDSGWSLKLKSNPYVISKWGIEIEWELYEKQIDYVTAEQLVDIEALFTLARYIVNEIKFWLWSE